MGTSQSNPGPGGGSPLVPPWADDQPNEPLPAPNPERFRAFRRAMGNYVRNGDGADLRSALGHYARTSSGGSGVAARRMGSVTRAGTALYGTLSGRGGAGSDFGPTIDLSTLTGLSCKAAIDAISRALSSDDGDSDRIRSAINYALVEALDGVEIFNADSITGDILIGTMINYLSESIFLQIVTDAGRAWTRADSASQAIAAENDLRQLIHVLVDKSMVTKLSGVHHAFTKQEISQIQREVIQSVWKEWEAY